MNSFLAIMIVPLRERPVLAATEYVIAPLPTPRLLDVTVIQGAVLSTLHTHPAAVTTLTAPEPPLGEKALAVGATV